MPRPIPRVRAKPGRPAKADPPRIPHEEIDRLLVYGEMVEVEGKEPEVHYPTYRQLADKYGVSLSSIAEYSKRHRCRRRRGEAAMRVATRAEDKIVEKRASKLAMNKSNVLGIIDEYLNQFRQALQEGRVRVDAVSDFNTIMRLKEFLEGGADSRQEVHTTLTLEQLQLKHKEELRRQYDLDDSLTGNVPSRKQLVEANGTVAASEGEDEDEAEEEPEPIPPEDDEQDEQDEDDEEPFVRAPALPALSRARFPEGK